MKAPQHSRYPLALACLRALSQDTTLPATTESDPFDLSHEGLSPDATPEQLSAHSDTIAMRRRFHQPDCHARYRPRTPPECRLFDILESARLGALGSQHYPGILANRLRAAGKRGSTNAEEALYITALLLWAPHDSSQPALQPSAELAEKLARLTPLIMDQDRFAEAALSLIPGLCKIDPCQTGTPAADEREQRTQAEQGRAAEDEPDTGVENRLAGETPEQPADETMAGASPHPHMDEIESPAYSRYSTAYDELIDAGRAVTAEEQTLWLDALNEARTKHGNRISRLAHRLQRQLMAQQCRRWSFDLEEGQLDSSRLAGLIAAPGEPNIFREEQPGPFIDTAVTLLIDSSGSMHGAPMTTAGLCVDVLVQTLERCGIRSEVLGFTTTEWEDNRARRAWNAAGRPENPGRLNGLRHIVYKEAATPWRRARAHFGLVMRNGFLKENIDGEALLWAHQRLIKRHEPRKILLVISDGSPQNRATREANSGRYLSDHLHDAIARLEKAGQVELSAIGIHHEVFRYYQRAVTVYRLEELAQTLLDHVGKLFGAPGPSKI
jgi:cobaltochelatase CobT